MTEEVNTNLDLYNLRTRLQKNRENLQQTNEKYVEVATKLDTIKASHDGVVSDVGQLADKCVQLEDKQNELSDKLEEMKKTMITFEDIAKKISEWSGAELQPVLNELCDDIENAISEVKLVRAKQLQTQQSFNKVEEDNLNSINVTSVKQPMKSLQLQKKGRL
jgi:archaellum component FlaC